MINRLTYRKEREGKVVKDQSLRVGRFYGIELRLHFTWFILFALVAWSFTAGVVPAVYGGLSTPTTIIIGLLATFLLFLSVVIHEFAHSLYAKKIGLNVNRITLFIFGGASELEDEPRTPRQEFIMAGLGPLTSLVLGVIFISVWLIGQAADFIPLAALGIILASANIALAIFNLIPGFPLDGGRMFRAAAWRFTRDIVKATRLATNIGKVFAILIIAYGILQIILLGNLGGAWLILIGFFLQRAASASYEQTLMRTLLQDVSVSDLMTSNNIAVVPGETKAGDFLQNYVRKHKLNALPVKSSSGNKTGMVSAEDAVAAPPNARVEDLAINGDQVLHPGDSAVKAINIMANSALQKVPVVDGGQVIGTLSLENLNSYLLSQRHLRSL